MAPQGVPELSERGLEPFPLGLVQVRIESLTHPL